MSSAPTDCRVPDPTDATADGQFQAVNRRAGYGDDRLHRAEAWARKGYTLAAGEGLVLCAEIDRLRDDLKYAQALLNQLHDLERLQDEIDLLREEMDATSEQVDELDRVWTEEVHKARKLEAILAKLREPSEAVRKAAFTYYYTSLVDAIRAAVAAAEQEVTNDPR